ncbi:hypothetical protein [Streptomyces sp. NPDC056323]|uniref:hypothetical protein n=1 Tax=Streptomyces sp. NPDC056323 TaxID=3345784 RepID=UPI0035D575BC
MQVFTGIADTPAAALRRAHEVYDAALVAHKAGIEIPHGRPDGWCACEYQPGWEPD